MTRKLSTLTSSTIMTKYQFMGITSYTSYSVIPYCHPVNMTNKCSKVSVSLDTKFVIHVLSCLFLFLAPLICPFIQCMVLRHPCVGLCWLAYIMLAHCQHSTVLQYLKPCLFLLSLALPKLTKCYTMHAICKLFILFPFLSHVLLSSSMSGCSW